MLFMSQPLLSPPCFSDTPKFLKKSWNDYTNHNKIPQTLAPSPKYSARLSDRTTPTLSPAVKKDPGQDSQKGSENIGRILDCQNARQWVDCSRSYELYFANTRRYYPWIILIRYPPYSWLSVVSWLPPLYSPSLLHNWPPPPGKVRLCTRRVGMNGRLGFDLSSFSFSGAAACPRLRAREEAKEVDRRLQALAAQKDAELTPELCPTSVSFSAAERNPPRGSSFLSSHGSCGGT